LELTDNVSLAKTPDDDWKRAKEGNQMLPAASAAKDSPPARLQIRSRLALASAWLAIVVGFVAYRTSDFFVWNDSPCLMYRAEDGGWPDVYERNDVSRREFLADPQRFLASFFRNQFDENGFCHGGGYRPLSGVQTFVSQLLMGHGGTPWALLVHCGSLYATFAISFYFVARRFVRFSATAVLAVVLVLASPSCIAASWVMVAGLQILVPLSICLSLLLYWHATDGPRLRIWSVVALCLMMLTGPWLREFTGIIPILVGCLELSRARRLTPLMCVAAVFFAHAVYPTALLKLLFFPELPLLPVTKLGHLGTQMSGAALRWFAGWHFIPLFPPVLLVTAAISAFIYFGRGSMVDDSLGQRLLRRVRVAAPFLWAAALAICLLTESPILPAVLCLGVAVVGFQQSVILSFWFVLSFAPLLRVFTEHVHFLYALAPASIILAGSLERLWSAVSKLNSPAYPRLNGLAHRVRWAIPALGFLIAADQGMTVYGSWQVVHAQYEGMKIVAQRLQQLPRGAAVVGNVIHLDEIKWLTSSYFQAYYAIGAGIACPWRVLEPDTLQALLAQRENCPVYFLDCDFEYLPTKINYHRHKYVHRSRVPKTDLGVIHVSQARYHFLDPLRHLVKPEHVPFLGPPDLENDFYRGRGRDPAPFTLEMYAIYHLYRVDGDDVETYSPNSIQLVESQQGFNILTDGNYWMAIPQSDGAFDVNRLIERGYSHQLTGKTIDSVRRQIADHMRNEPTSAIALAGPVLVPRLVQEGYQGFNLVAYAGQVYAIPQGDGAFDITRFTQNGYRRQFAGATVEVVRQQIDGHARHEAALAAATSEIRAAAPRLVLEGYQGFNLIECGGRIYGLPQTAGEFEEARARRGEYERLVQGDSIASVKGQIDKLSSVGPVATRPTTQQP
jgi:hypothetical protein